MTRYKLLKNVAHNLGHSFTSLMNFAGTDYAMGHILRFARQTGHDTLRINLVTGEAEPPELLAPPITELPVRYMQMFWYLVDRHGSDRSFVQDARLLLRFDTSQARPAQVAPQFQESPYTCDVTLIDVRGNEYLAHFEGWWFPEVVSRGHASYRPSSDD